MRKISPNQANSPPICGLVSCFQPGIPSRLLTDIPTSHPSIVLSSYIQRCSARYAFSLSMPVNLRSNSATSKNENRQPTQLTSTQSTPPASNFQASTRCLASVSQLASTKRKRLQDADELEDVRPSKQLKELPTLELSEANLRLFDREMDTASSDSRPGSMKRSSSQRSA